METYWGNVNPVGVRSCYDESKRYAEALTMAYHRDARRADQHRADFQHLRPAHGAATTGAWCRRFSIRRCAGQPLTIFGDGSQTRSFCYVSDLVDGLVRLVTRKSAFP